MSNPNLDRPFQNVSAQDREFENTIRPAAMDAFAGQPQLIENISIFIKAAKLRGEALDHILFQNKVLINLLNNSKQLFLFQRISLY
jgi:Holliday junction DNA helicase RuvB